MRGKKYCFRLDITKKEITFITQLMDAKNENEPIIPKANIIIWIIFYLDR